MSLKNKKIACFLALPHHTRFFIPIMEEIKKQGGEIVFIVPLSDYPYELDLIRRNLSFRYFADYMTDDVKHRVHDSKLKLFDRWTKDCFKWDGFSRWPLFKQNWFFDSLVEEYFCMEKFIEIEKPDMFIAHHEATRWGKIIGHLAYKNGIPFVTFQEGDYYGDQGAFIIHTEYSTVDLLWGNATIKWLMKYKCSEDKMIPNGNTHIDDAIQKFTSPEMIKYIKKDINVPLNKKIILFLVDIKYGGITDKEVWQRFLKGLDKLDKEAVCIFKWHPNVYMTAYEQIQEIFKELYPSAMLLYTYDPYRLIAISDYCVTLGKTSLAIEALAFGKPLFAMPTSDTLEDYYVKMGVAQTVFPPGNWSNLFGTMENGVPAYIKSNVERYLIEYFYNLDGRSVERAIGVMDYIFEVKKEKIKVLKKVKPVPDRISFIIPSGNDPEALLATLTSLSQNVKYPDWEVIIVLNDENVRDMLSDISGDIKIINSAGDSLSALYNKGAETATGEYLIFMRPGIIFYKEGDLLIAMMDSIAGLPVKNADMVPYCLGIGYDFNFTPYKITDESKQPDAVGGGFIAMKRGIFELVGCFDEEMANHLIEPDICLRARESGIPVKYLSNGLVFNYAETFFGDDVSAEKWKNRIRFYAKWVGRLPKDEDFLSFAKELLKV